jgi:hypothetical protein
MAGAVLPAPTFRRHWTQFALAVGIALALIAIWPLLLWQNQPGLWQLWWQNELAEATQARALPSLRHLELLLWAAWPVLPIALWSVWLHRHRLTILTIPLLGLVVSLLWVLSGTARSLAILPLLIPLTLLAATGVDQLRRGAANAFDWFAIMTFSVFGVLIWLGASAQALDWPAKIAANFDKLAPGHDVAYPTTTIAFALTLTLIWIISWRLPRTSWRGNLHWAGGMTLLWALLTTLWLSWIDHGTSYRAVATALRAVLPASVDCLERINLGPAQRASLDYFAGLRTQPSGNLCTWRLRVSDRNHQSPSGWETYWQGQRPSDRKDRWYLERRLPDTDAETGDAANATAAQPAESAPDNI